VRLLRGGSPLGWLALIVVLLGLLLLLGYSLVYGYTVDPTTLGTPVVVIGALLALLTNSWLAFIQNRAQREREESIENKQTQDARVAVYTEKMTELVIEKNLHKPSSDPHVRRVAHALTISVLLQIDGERKRIPLKVVYVLGLLEKDKPLLGLEDASLDHADLTEFRLRGAYLTGIDLRGANLEGSDLTGSDLSYADLRGANLTYTDLSNADLSGANLLPYDEYEPAKLSLYNLKDHALPSDNYLRSLAKLQEEERFRGLSSRLTRRVKNRLLLRKLVTFTNLTDVKLTGANLTGAILANADLRDVRDLTQEQIDSAIGNSETQVPKGLKLPEAWVKEIEVQIKVFHTE
jgi:hypothetical protein